jgi:hypothetical protein
MIGQRHAGFAVMLADEAAIPAKARFRKARIADDDLLQAQQLVAVEELAAGLANGAAASLDAVLRRSLALDGEA